MKKTEKCRISYAAVNNLKVLEETTVPPSLEKFNFSIKNDGTLVIKPRKCGEPVKTPHIVC